MILQNLAKVNLIKVASLKDKLLGCIPRRWGDYSSCLSLQAGDTSTARCAPDLAETEEAPSVPAPLHIARFRLLINLVSQAGGGNLCGAAAQMSSTHL